MAAGILFELDLLIFFSLLLLPIEDVVQYRRHKVKRSIRESEIEIIRKVLVVIKMDSA